MKSHASIIEIYQRALKSLELTNKVSYCEVKALRINNTVEYDVNSVLKGFKKLRLNFSEKPSKIAPQTTQ